MKKILPIIVVSILLLGSPLLCLASGFQLKTIGAMNVDGVIYDQLWYSSGKVTFTGIALAGAEVTVIIDGTSAAVTADESGNWSYSTTLVDGDHAVSFTSNESTISLTLTIGEVPADVGTLPTAETPTAGVIEPTIIIGGLGLLLLSLPLLLRRAFV